MQVGDLVKPTRIPADLIGLVTRIREFATRDDVVYVRWQRPTGWNRSWTESDRWYDVSNLSVVKRHDPLAHSADPM